MSVVLNGFGEFYSWCCDLEWIVVFYVVVEMDVNARIDVLWCMKIGPMWCSMRLEELQKSGCGFAFIGGCSITTSTK